MNGSFRIGEGAAIKPGFSNATIGEIGLELQRRKIIQDFLDKDSLLKNVTKRKEKDQWLYVNLSFEEDLKLIENSDGFSEELLIVILKYFLSINSAENNHMITALLNLQRICAAASLEYCEEEGFV